METIPISSQPMAHNVRIGMETGMVTILVDPTVIGSRMTLHNGGIPMVMTARINLRTTGGKRGSSSCSSVGFRLVAGGSSASQPARPSSPLVLFLFMRGKTGAETAAQSCLSETGPGAREATVWDAPAGRKRTSHLADGDNQGGFLAIGCSVRATLPLF